MSVAWKTHRSGLGRFGSNVRLAAPTLVLAGVLALPAAATTTFYVDNQSAACSNAGTGTEARPYCTISAAVAAARGWASRSS